MFTLRQQCWILVGLLAGISVAHSADPEVRPTTAWGRPIDGLQAGIRIRSNEPTGDAVLELQVVIRNVARTKRTFRYSPALYFWGEDQDGVVSVRTHHVYGGYWAPGAAVLPSLKPNEDYSIGTMSIHRGTAKQVEDLWKSRRSPLGAKLAQFNTLQTTVLAPGLYRIGVRRVELELDNRKTVELGTGYLDVAILEQK